MARQLATLLLLSCVGLSGMTSSAQDYKGHKYKGTLDSVDVSKLVLRQQDAETIEFLIVPQTKFMRDDRPAKLEELQRDDVAVVTAQREGNLLVALNVFVMEPE